MAKHTIVVDIMGGDNAPQAPLEGALLALEKFQDLSIIMTGKEPVIRSLLEGKTYDESRLQIVHTEEVVENEEHSPADAVRSKRDASMTVAMRMVRREEADGMVSAGNTGAVLAGSTMLIGRIKGIKRPALTLPLPIGNPPVVVLDIGANMDPKPMYMQQFAHMATIYYQKMYGVAKPRVALLNVGVEEGKGNELMKEVFYMLKEDESINFIGNIEARDVMGSVSDIVVTDAFSGNVLLKTLEGTAGYIMSTLKTEVGKSFKNKIGALLMKPALRGLKHSLDPTEVGGTPLLGVNGCVIKAHGNSNGVAIYNAIRQCRQFIDSGVNEEIAKKL